MNDPRVSDAGDACLALTFTEVIDRAVNERCVAAAAEIDRLHLDGVRDVVPAYHTVAVFFDPRRIDREALRRRVRDIASRLRDTESSADREPHRIEVSYGGSDGPDLPSVAEFAGLSEQDVIQLHSKSLYRVYMLGFLPGFAYLGTVDSRIAMPRLDSPRMRVPAGSVAIAGEQTGIYPSESPGGWRIIGRTHARIFDSTRPTPALLRAGDRVQFVPAT